MIKIDEAKLHYETLPLKDEVFTDLLSLLSVDQMTYADKRKMDYLAGRLCGLEALKKLNIQVNNIPMQKDRSPLWPDGIVGSITHTNGIAIAAVSNSLKGIGIDAERLMSENRYKKISKMFVSENEKSLVETNLEINPTLIFSAKESLYKALYPQCMQYFGFLEATLISIKKNSFEIELHSEHSSVKPLDKIYSGKYSLFNDLLVSWITIK